MFSPLSFFFFSWTFNCLWVDNKSVFLQTCLLLSWMIYPVFSQWLFYIPMKIKIKCPCSRKEEEGILIESPIFFVLFIENHRWGSIAIYKYVWYISPAEPMLHHRGKSDLVHLGWGPWALAFFNKFLDGADAADLRTPKLRTSQSNDYLNLGCTSEAPRGLYEAECRDPPQKSRWRESHISTVNHSVYSAASVGPDTLQPRGL